MFYSCTLVLSALLLQHASPFHLSMVSSFSRDQILKPFRDGNAFKVISGLNNFDSLVVQNVVKAASVGGASHIDIACDPELIKLSKATSRIPVCVSAVEPAKFVSAVDAGADMIEIGNFDCFYEEGISFSADDVIQMTRETRLLLPSTVLSVTIPHQLPLHEQMDLAKKLEECGADIIQTEGKVSANIAGMGVQEQLEIAAPTIAAAYAISRAVSIPVMCASGLSDITAPLALAAGARGVGIGSMINKLKSVTMMTMAVSAVAAAMGRKANNDEAEIVDMEETSPVLSTVSDRVYLA